MEIPLVDGNGQISGVLCQCMPPSGVRGAFVSRGPGETRAIEDVAQLVVHDINNFLAVIGSGLRLLEGQSNSADRTVIVVKMQQAISRGALLSRHLLEAARPCPDFMDAGTLDQAITDLWDFNADPEELYLALLNLRRNSVDAPPDGGTITVASLALRQNPEALGDGLRTEEQGARRRSGVLEGFARGEHCQRANKSSFVVDIRLAGELAIKGLKTMAKVRVPAWLSMVARSARRP